MVTVHDDKTARELEAELHTEILPGTEIMADVGSHHFVKGAHHTVLVPQPSADPHDPLNWSTPWKVACITSAAMVTFTQGFGPLALAPMFPALMESFECGLQEAVQFTGVCILVLGFSNFLWVPISTSFGRRPVYLFSQLINFGTSIWRAKATSYNSFMGACVVNGLGAGPAETIMPEVIADIFFLHDRGKWNTLYWVVYMGSLMVGPIVSGSMAEEVGWRSFFWLNTALLGISFLMVVTLFPETRFNREEVKPGSPDLSETEKEQPTTLENTAKTKTDNKEIIQQVPTADSELPTTEGLAPEDTAARDPYLGRGTPGKWQWAVFQPNAHPFRSIFLDLWIPWKLFAFPIVEFASFVVSWSCSSFLTINLTQSQAFAAPPYNMKPMAIGKSIFTRFNIISPIPLHNQLTPPCRLPKLCHPNRRPDRPLHGRAPERLRIRALHTPQQRHPRARNASPRHDPLHNNHVPRQYRRSRRLRAPLALGSHRHHRLHVRRHPSSGAPRHKQHLRRRQLQARSR